jgi:NADH/NAD ratio-sensing transcriptional regulator Rex
LTTPVEPIDVKIALTEFCEKLLSEGTTSTTVKEIQKKTGVADYSIRERFKLFESYKIKVNISKRLSFDDLKSQIAEYCKSLLNEDITSIEVSKAQRETGIYRETIRRNVALFKNNGIALIITNPAILNEDTALIKDLCKKLIEKSITKITTSEASKQTGLNYGKLSRKASYFFENGVELVNPNNAEKKEKKILDYIKELKNQEITSIKITDVSRAINIGRTFIRKKSSLFETNGILLGSLITKEHLAKDSILEEYIERLIKNKIYIIEAQKIHKATNINIKAILKKEQLFKEKGIAIITNDTKKNDFLVNNYIQTLLKENISTITIKEACLAAGVSNMAIQKRESFFENNGIRFKKNTVTKSNEIKKIIENFCTNLSQNNIKFINPKEVADEINLDISTIKRNKDVFEKNGITLNTKTQSETKAKKKQEVIIGNCKKIGLKFNSANAFNEYSEDFLLIKTSLELIENSEIYTKLSRLEIRKLLEQTIIDLNNLYDIEDYYIKEIKYLLYKKSIFIDEATIKNILIEDLNINEEALIKDKIEKRIRFSNMLANDKFEKVIYTNSLPDINNSENGELIVLNKYKSKENLQSLWDKYCIFMVKNNFSGSPANKIHPDLNKWDNTLESLYEIHEGYKSICFKDHYGQNFLKHGYESLAAMALHACNNINNKTKGTMLYKFQAIQRRITGFIMFLVSEGVLLAHPKFLRLTGGGSGAGVSDFVDFIFKKHLLHNVHNDVNTSENSSASDLKKLNVNNIHVHTRKLATATNPAAELKTTSADLIWCYIDTSEDFTSTISSTMKHSEYILTLLRNYGNNNALKMPSLFDPKDYFNITIAKSKTTFSKREIYAELTKDILNICYNELRYAREKKSPQTISNYIRAYIMLLEFLEQFDKKLTRSELSKVLNNIHKDTNDNSYMFSWAKDKEVFNKYKQNTSTYLMFFSNLQTTNNYRGIYDKDWILYRSISEKTLEREGLELAVYSTLQDVAFNAPPASKTYNLKEYTPTGEKIDITWWTDIHGNIPIIPAVCNWLTCKLPRRMMHVRWLDVNKFFKFENGIFKGLEFSTEKSRKKKNMMIPANLVKIIFDTQELEFLKKYIDYIKLAYSNLLPIHYEGGGDYEPIQPLFPHHQDNNVIQENTLIGMHNKCMLRAQFRVRELAEKGELDSFYGDDELRKTKIEQLKNCTLLFNRPETDNNKQRKVPESIEEIEELNYSDSQYKSVFTTRQGIHNMRHAGASALYELGVPVFIIQKITGHINPDVLNEIYIHESDSKIVEIIKKIQSKKIKFYENLDINKPVKNGNCFIKESITPLFEEEDSKLILDILIDNHFMSLERGVSNPEVAIFGKAIDNRTRTVINNGLEIASKLNPNLNWIAKNEGICSAAGHCPDGTNCICCFCPLLIFSPLHIKGIEFKLQQSYLSYKLLERKMLISQQSNSYSSNYQEFFMHYQLKLEEFYAWYEMLELIKDKINNIESKNSQEETLNKHNKIDKLIISSREVTVNHQILELLVRARKLEIDSDETDNYKARIAAEIYQTALMNDGIETARELAFNGIDNFIELFGKKSFEKKKEFIKQSIRNLEDTSRLKSIKNYK